MANSLRRSVIALAALLLLGAALGCGNERGDSSRATSNEASNRTEGTSQQSRVRTNPRHQPNRRFLRQANAVCRRLIPNAEQIRRRYLFESDIALQQRGFSALAAEVSGALGQIKALRQPASGRREIRRVYSAAEAGITELEQAATDPEVAQEILSGVDPFAKTALLARAFGLTACQATAGISRNSS